MATAETLDEYLDQMDGVPGIEGLERPEKFSIEVTA